MDGRGAFTVHRPDHWLFEGTELKRGDAFGGKDTIVGYECDGCEFDLEGRAARSRRTATARRRASTILATAPARWHPDDCEWYEKWEKGRTGNAVVGTYTRGGTVVTVGTHRLEPRPARQRPGRDADHEERAGQAGEVTARVRPPLYRSRQMTTRRTFLKASAVAVAVPAAAQGVGPR